MRHTFRDLTKDQLDQAPAIHSMTHGLISNAGTKESHTFESIHNSTVPYFGLKRKKITCIMCRTAGCHMFCIQCTKKNLFPLLVICCTKCMKNHKNDYDTLVENAGFPVN